MRSLFLSESVHVSNVCIHDYSIHETASQPQMKERRAQHRRRVLKRGTITFNKGYGCFGCQIRNMTDQGVMIEMGETSGVPTQFLFKSDDEAFVPARAVWRSANRMGIVFDG